VHTVQFLEHSTAQRLRKLDTSVFSTQFSKVTESETSFGAI